MGDTGPCGPCSEIFYDHDPDGTLGIKGGPPGSPDEDGDRWIEIWNLVFMQFDRASDGTLSRLPAPSVDTGMGLERIAAVMQGVQSNYDTDTFKALIGAAADLAGVQPGSSDSLKVIADHIRATSFLIADGVVPSNEGRGYVLRRIMRRAIRHGHKLGLKEPFFYKLVGPLGAAMGVAYPELLEQRATLERAIRQEEEGFAATLDKGMKLLEDAIARASGGVIPGETVFKLYDTYGFPVDLTADVARERGLGLDQAAYEREMDAQRARARAASSFTADYSQNARIEARSEFTGYEQQAHGARVTALLRGGTPVEQIEAGEEAVVFLDRTPFYAESGGQVGDTGALTAPGTRFAVSDTQALNPEARGHIGRLESGRLRVGDSVRAEIDAGRRDAIRRNHSATHLLHAALRQVLGTHVTQKGSLVAPQRLRFDFSHDRAVTAEELTRIEDLVNREVLANCAAEVKLSNYDEAVRAGAMALFGEKYGDVVRVLRFGDFSTELCGGTHVARTGDIGLFKIVAESGVAAGVRRVEALTGLNALAYLREMDTCLRDAASVLRCGRDEICGKIEALLDSNKQLEKELAQLKGRLAASAGDELTSQAQNIGGVKVLVARTDGVEGNELRLLLDQLKNKLGSGIVLLAAANGGKVSLIAGVTADLTDRLKAGELVNVAAAQVGGKGGGRPDMAQAGGSRPEALPAALDAARAWITEKLTG
jgi:alanyl-tRNA synthetase